MADEGVRLRIEKAWEGLMELSLVVKCGKDGISIMGPDEKRSSPEAQDLQRQLEQEYAADPELVCDVIGRESGGRFGSARRGGKIPSQY